MAYQQRYLIAVVAALIFTGLGFKVAPAQSGATRYVDGAAGVDQGSCTDPTAACATIGYALEEAQNGDQILVSAGTYVENLDVYERVCQSLAAIRWSVLTGLPYPTTAASWTAAARA